MAMSISRVMSEEIQTQEDGLHAAAAASPTHLQRSPPPVFVASTIRPPPRHSPASAPAPSFAGPFAKHTRLPPAAASPCSAADPVPATSLSVAVRTTAPVGVVDTGEAGAVNTGEAEFQPPRFTNSRFDDVENLPNSVSRAGFRMEGSSLSAGSTSLQLLSSYQTQTQPIPAGIIDFVGREGGKSFISAEKPDLVLHNLCWKKSELEMEENLFAEHMDIRDSDSDSFYSEGLYSSDDEMEDDTFLDLDERLNDMEDDSSEEESDDCFYKNFIVGSKQKQMGEYDEQSQSMQEDDRRMEDNYDLIKKPNEEKVDILGDEDVVQVERGIVRYWAYANFSCLSQEESHRFVTRIVDMCVAIGMEFTLSPIKEAQAAPTDIESTLVDLHGKIIDHLTNCGSKEEQLGILIVILPDNIITYDKVEGVCQKLGITYHVAYTCEAIHPRMGHLKRIARAIQSKVVRRDARLRRLALPIVFEAPTLFFGADVFRCTPGDEGSDYVSSVATSLDWPKFRRYFVRISHNEGTVNVSAQLGAMITKFIYLFSKATKRTVEKIIFFRNGLKGGHFDNTFCHQEMSAIKMACAYFMDGYEPHITYVVVLPHEKREMTNKCGIGEDLTGYKFWCRHSGGKNFSAEVCYHVVHDENNFMPGELQSLTSKLCNIHDRRACPEIDTVPPAFYARHGAMAALENLEARSD